jgi:hypothetical protein
MSAPTLKQAAPPSEYPNAPAGVAEPERSDPKGSDLDQTVSFPELVWAHFQRQNELVERNGLEGSREDEYRRRLKVFKAEHGELVNAYWCRYEASGAALTDKERPLRWRPWQKESILRLHTATSWSTREVPEVAELLHTCETLAIRIGEVLRGTTQRIALQWTLAVASSLLGAVDREQSGSPADTPGLAATVKAQRAELAEIARYYHRAGQKASRLVYFGGMMRGVVALMALGGLALLVLWPFDAVHPHRSTTQDLFVAFAMGALGAVVSVMSRMASDRFRLDHEVGRKPIRRLGSFRPFIGAIFALVLYFALKSDLLEIGKLQAQNRTIYFYATIAFLGGFSERWAKVILDGAVGGSESAENHPPSRPPPR